MDPKLFQAQMHEFRRLGFTLKEVNEMVKEGRKNPFVFLDKFSSKVGKGNERAERLVKILFSEEIGFRVLEAASGGYARNLENLTEVRRDYIAAWQAAELAKEGNFYWLLKSLLNAATAAMLALTQKGMGANRELTYLGKALVWFCGAT